MLFNCVLTQDHATARGAVVMYFSALILHNSLDISMSDEITSAGDRGASSEFSIELLRADGKRVQAPDDQRNAAQARRDYERGDGLGPPVHPVRVVGAEPGHGGRLPEVPAALRGSPRRERGHGQPYPRAVLHGCIFARTFGRVRSISLPCCLSIFPSPPLFHSLSSSLYLHLHFSFSTFSLPSSPI